MSTNNQHTSQNMKQNHVMCRLIIALVITLITSPSHGQGNIPVQPEEDLFIESDDLPQEDTKPAYEWEVEEPASEAPALDTVFSRTVEYTVLQGLGGFVLTAPITAVSALIHELLFAFSSGDTMDYVVVMGLNTVFAQAPAAALATYGLGRFNGSNASLDLLCSERVLEV